ncbi:outer membrane biogenesis protein BamB [Phycisphaerae bacterium RAS1]|nr:outer membrane biogenesis protein BamB [Phycisphaerae bacterium RAS1]
MTRSISALTVALALAVARMAAAGDWPNFRGPNHDGISDETGLKVAWSTPLKLIWERNVGSAFSSFACVADRVFTCGTQDKQQVLFCLNADSGAVLWQTPLEGEYVERQGGDGTRATPTVCDGKVYILGARGKLLCADAETGKQVWSRQFSHAPRWGYSGSVLIEGEIAVVSAGEGDGALLALDRKTGKEIWTCGGDPAGYATPYPFTFDGMRYIAAFTGDSLLIAAADDGKPAFRMGWKTDWNVNAAAPIFSDGRLFFSSGYQHGATLLKLSRSGDKLEGAALWESKVLREKFQSSVLFEGHLYTSDEVGLKCVELSTGKEQWKVRRITHGTLTLAEGHLYLLTEDGKLEIAKATPAEYKALTSAEILSGRCWSAAVLFRGRIYARNLDRLVCFSLKE